MLAQGLGGLMAAGILNGMDHTRGIRGWRWVCPSDGFRHLYSHPVTVVHHRRFHYGVLLITNPFHSCRLSFEVSFA
jgi:hypothetical protein